jgi:hypothetical protein
LGPHAQATRDTYKSRRYLLPYPFRPTRVAQRRRHLKTLGAAAIFDLRGRGLSAVKEQCRSFAWR